MNIVAVLVFAAVLIFAGLRFGGSDSSSQYHMASRAVSWIRVAFSCFSVAGGGEIVTLVAFTYLFGIWGLALFAGFSLGFVGLAYAAKRFRTLTNGLEIYSIPDFVRYKYGNYAGVLAFVYSSLSVAALLLIQLIVGGLLISALTGLETWIGSAIIVVTVAAYIIAGGFKSVLVTDIIQSVAMFLAIALLIVITQNSPYDFLYKLSSLTAQGIPLGDAVTLVISGFFAVFGAADIWQRMLSARSNVEAKKGLITTGVAFLIFGILIISFGAIVASTYPNADPNNAFIEMLQDQIGGIVGLILTILVTASVFSTADTELFVLSTMTSRELIERDLKKSCEIQKSRIIVATILTVSFVASIFLSNLVDIYLLLVFFFMILGPTIICALLGRGTNTTIAISLFLSGLILIALLITGNVGGYLPLLSLVPGLIPLFFNNNE